MQAWLPLPHTKKLGKMKDEEGTPSVMRMLRTVKPKVSLSVLEDGSLRVRHLCGQVLVKNLLQLGHCKPRDTKSVIWNP